MIGRGLIALAAALLLSAPAHALCTATAVPYSFTNGTTADANQVNTDFASVISQMNSFFPLSVPCGGTGLTATSPISIKTFTAIGATTYTPTSGMTFAVVFATGSGSAGTGIAGSGLTYSQSGGAGETMIGVYSAAQIGASLTVTIGNPGQTPHVAPFFSTAAGDTTFGSLMTLKGGKASISNGNNGGSGGTATGTVIDTAGGSGSYVGGGNTTLDGAASFWGRGGVATGVSPGDATICGSGGSTQPATTVNWGGVGAPGCVYVLEFFGPS